MQKPIAAKDTGMPQSAAAKHRRDWLAPVPWLLLLLTAAFFAVRIWHGVSYDLFVDESDHIVGGMALDHGAILYRSFIDAHGPVIFMFTQAYGAIFGWANPNNARLMSAGLALLTASAIAASSAFGDRTAKAWIPRVWAATLFLGVLASVWVVQGLYMVSYHTLAGCLLAIGLALWAAPAWRRRPVRPIHAFCAGSCFALVIATAYSFAPAILSITVSAAWAARQGPARPGLPAFMAGGVAAFLAVLIWLLVFGDVVGYVIFHFITNQFIYSKYLAALGFLSPRAFLTGLVPSLQPIALVHCMALACWALSCVVFLVFERASCGRPALYAPILLGFAGLLALCVRGGTLFQDGCFLVATIALAAMAIAMALAGSAVRPRMTAGFGTLAGTLVIGLCIAGAELAMRQAITSPGKLTRAELVQFKPVSMGVSPLPEYARIRALTPAGDQVLVMPYKPFVNLWSGRPPMDKYIAYLPWDADYAKAPWFGHERDLCADMEKTPPKLVYFDNWIVWGKWSMTDYAPCFVKILSQSYQRQTDFPNLYLRRDMPR